MILTVLTDIIKLMKKSLKWIFLYAVFLLVFTFLPNNKQLQNNLKDVLDSIDNEKSESQVRDFQRNENGYYKVVSVVDGDTIKIDFEGDTKTVRLIGIDTPETNHPSEPVQCYGKEASQKTKELLENKTVKLEQDVSETDRYGRILAYVWLDEFFINEKIVKEGYAFSSSYPPDIKYQDILDEAEIFARENKAGLWAEDTCNGDVYTGTAMLDNQNN